MGERIKVNGEYESSGIERRSSAERHKPAHEAEKSQERQREQLESARKSAEKESVSAHKIRLEKDPDAPVRITRQDKDRAYKQTMGLVQASLPKPSRRFSRLIHQPTVARVSETAEKSVARPGAILGAGLAATAGLSIMLFFARRYGFSLSGSEFIVLMLGGWLLGLVIDLLNSRFGRTQS